MSTAKAALQHWDDFARWAATRLVVDMITAELLERTPRTAAIIIEADGVGEWDDVVELRADGAPVRRSCHQVKGGERFGSKPEDTTKLLAAAASLDDAEFTLWVHGSPHHPSLSLADLKSLCDVCASGTPLTNAIRGRKKKWTEHLEDALNLSRVQLFDLLSRVRVERFEDHERLRRDAQNMLAAARLPEHLADSLHAHLWRVVNHGNVQIDFQRIARDCMALADALASVETRRTRQIAQRRSWLHARHIEFAALRPAGRLLRRVRGGNRQLSDMILQLDCAPIDQQGMMGTARFSLLDLWDRTRGPLLLTGEVGSGKSTALRALAHELALRTDEYESSPVPVLISAAELARKRRDFAAPLGLSDIVGQDVVGPVSLDLFVDGFDEIRPAFMQDGEQCVRELASQSFINRLVVASRPLGMLQFDNSFQRYGLCPWSPDQTMQFACSWGADAPAAVRRLSGGNPLMITLACAYAGQVSGGLMALLRRVVDDVLTGWQEYRPTQLSAVPDRSLVEDCCLWLLLGSGDVDICQPQQASLHASDAVLDYLEYEGLVSGGPDPVVPAGARPAVEYLAACCCVRKGFHFEHLCGRVELLELAKMVLGLELLQSPAEAAERLLKVLSLHADLDPFRLRVAVVAARACALQGDRLPSQAVEPMVECLWSYVTSESSRWKSAVASEALAALCDANAAVAELIRQRAAVVLCCSDTDSTESLAASHGLLHNSPRVRAEALRRLPPLEIPAQATLLFWQMHDDTFVEHESVAVAAGCCFRELERTPEVHAFVEKIREWLRYPGLSAAAAAVALHPGEAPIADLAHGIQYLAESGQCPASVRDAFLNYPGGREAADAVRGNIRINDSEYRIADATLRAIPSRPVPRYSYYVQRACWQLLIPALHGQPNGLTELAELAEVAQRQATGGNPAALNVIIENAERQPQPLIQVLREARPWGLCFDGTVTEQFERQIGSIPSIFESYIDYLERCIQTNYTGQPPDLRALEGLLDLVDVRRVFVSMLPRAWTSFVGAYQLPHRLVSYSEVAEAARGCVDRWISEVEGNAERSLYPPAAAVALNNAAWLLWEEPTVLQERLRAWLERGSSYARLVGLLLPNVPPDAFDALLPALEIYLRCPFTPGDYEDAEARRLIFTALPKTEQSLQHRTQLAEFAQAHVRAGTIGSLAAAARLCTLLPADQARAVAVDAAERLLHTAGFPDADIPHHLRALVSLEPAAWLRAAEELHPLSLRDSVPIYEALFECLPPLERNIIAHRAWFRLGNFLTPHRLITTHDMVGRRPADIAEEWLFHHADRQPFEAADQIVDE